MPRKSAIVIRQGTEADLTWKQSLLSKHWGSTRIMLRGRLHDASQLSSLVAVVNGRKTGLLTYRITEDECEVVTLNSLSENSGVGSALLEAAENQALSERCARMWLITTNDNARALRFYQKRGFRIVAVRLRALEEARRLKPEIPLLGLDGIPILDEIELEKALSM